MSEDTSKLLTSVSSLACTGERDLVEQRKINSLLPVNRLPPDLLSRIILIGVSSDRRISRWKSRRRVGSQQVASHVCSYWRDVAINIPILWTFIHIIRNPPDKQVELYLSRAGSQTLLDILIDFQKIFAPEEYKRSPPCPSRKLSEVIRFLDSSGASANRWRSVFVRSSRPDVLPVLAGYLNVTSPSNLKSVRFECHCDTYSPHYDQDRISEAEYSAKRSGDDDWYNTRSYNLLGSSLPGLRELELVSAGCSHYIQTMTTFPSLRYLAIMIDEPDSAELAMNLESNPQLERLYLKRDTYYRGPEWIHIPKLTRPVMLPSLRSLHIHVHARDRAVWVPLILSIIKAPILHHFSIASAANFERRNLVSYIATQTSSVNEPGDSGVASGPVYPSIESLDISRFRCNKKEFTRLVTSFPHLTHIAIRRKQAEWLSEMPWLVSKLESVAVPSWEVEEARNALRGWPQRGHAIKSMELREGYLKLIGLQTQASSNPGSQMDAMPQYTFHKYNEEQYDQGDLQRAWQRLGFGG